MRSNLEIIYANLLNFILAPHSFGLVFILVEKKLRGMTDIDFRRFASLLFTLQLIGNVENPIIEGVKLADELLGELQKNE